MLNNAFSELGFSKKETLVYLALLKLDNAIAADIAKETTLNRVTVYDMLKILMQRGLVSKFKKGSKTYFHALEPKRLLDYLDREREKMLKINSRQKEKISGLLPELISLQTPHSTRPKVEFFEGERGVREAYEDTLTARNTIHAYTNVETMESSMPDFFPEYWKRRTKAKIPIDAIFIDNEKSRIRAKYNNEELRRTKFFPQGTQAFSPEIKIYNNKMVVASWEEKVAVIIESKELADLQRTVFKTLWKLLPTKKYDNKKLLD